MKKMIFSAVAFAVVAVSAVAVAPTTSEAVPAFARQTGAACLSCHFQTIPRLTAFGRNFRMNAFRDMGEQGLIEDEHLSLPATFNAAFLMKARFSTGTIEDGAGLEKSKGGVIGTPAGNGESIAVQFPDESALLFGGRLGEHAGIFNEWDVINGSMLGAKMAYVFDLDAGLVALTIGTTDALGMPSIFNDPSNAVSRNTRGIQARARSLRSTVMHTGATAVGAYAYLADSIYVAVGTSLGKDAGGTQVGNSGVDVTINPYFRAAWTGDVAGFDVLAGGWYAQTSDANYKRSALQTKNERTEYGLDFQAQGDLGDVSIGFYLPIVLSSKTKNAATAGSAAIAANAFHAAVLAVAPTLAGEDKVTGFMPYVNIGFGRAGVRLGYDSSTTESTLVGVADVDDTNFIFGAWYDVAQNLILDLEVNVLDRTGGPLADERSGTLTTLEIEYVY
ncbi:MAG: hypothetical protein R8K54_05920 [Mariprofundaceae bacterium]